MLQFASVLRLEINRAVAVLREIALGRDMKKFLAVCQYLLLVYLAEDALKPLIGTSCRLLDNPEFSLLDR